MENYKLYLKYNFSEREIKLHENPDNQTRIMTVTFNTNRLTQCMINSVNKTTPNAVIYVIDNGDKQKFTTDTENVILIDNTDGRLVDTTKWINSWTIRHSTNNSYGTARHCKTIDAFIKEFNLKDFILMDSDTLAKRNLSELIDPNYITVCDIQRQLPFMNRIIPFVAYLNSSLINELNIDFCDNDRIHSIYQHNWRGRLYDTGASFYEDIDKKLIRQINFNDYIEHLGSASWAPKSNNFNEKWLNDRRYLWDTPDPNLDIFIAAHKPFKPIVNNPTYKILTSNLNDNSPYNLEKITVQPYNLPCDEHYYSELYQYFYAIDNLPLKKYTGFCGYRKYYGFMDDIPNMDDIFSQYDVIVGYKENLGNTIKKQYAQYHNPKDLELIRQALQDIFPEYIETFDNCMNDTDMYCCNMFIMKKDDLLIWKNFIEKVLKRFVEVTTTDFTQHVKDNIKNYRGFPDIYQQSRIPGYLGERLTHVFIKHNFTNPYFTQHKTLQRANIQIKPVTATHGRVKMLMSRMKHNR